MSAGLTYRASSTPRSGELVPQLVAWAVVAASALLALLRHGWAPLNHDVAWVVLGAYRMLDGAEFGRDVVDVNPPMAWWLAVAPAWLSRLAGLEPGTGFISFMILLTATSLLLADRILRSGDLAPTCRALLVAGSGAVLLLVPGYDFGQREHILTLAVLPYLCIAALRAADRAPGSILAASAGLFAALGICMKPHFLLVPLAVETWLILRRRSLLVSIRPETLAMLGFGLVYLAAVSLVTPDYLDAVVPDAFATYHAYEDTVATVVRNFTQEGWFILLLLAGSALLARSVGDLGQALLAGGFGTFAAALLQQKGWSYHLYPALALFWLAALAVIGAAAAGRPARLGAAAALLAFAFAFPGSVKALGAWGEDRPSGIVTELTALFRGTAESGGSVFAFITSPRDIHPAVLDAGAEWAADACCLFFLPAAVKDPSNAQALAVARRRLDALADQLESRPPAVIAVDAGSNKLGLPRGFDYIQFIRAEPRLAALLAGYTEAEPVGRFRIFRRSGGG